MGIIQRQSIKNSIVSYSGVLIGMFSILYIYKLDEEIYGFAQFIYTTALFLTPFASLGIASSVIKFFPQYSKKKAAFFNSFFLMMILVNIAFILLFYVFRESLATFLADVGMDKNKLIGQYTWVILPLCFVLNINMLLINHSSNMLRIVVPEIFNNLGYKIALPIIVFCAYKGFLDYAGIGISILSFFILVSVLMFGYLMILGAIRIKDGLLRGTSRQLKSELSKYSLFSGMNTIGTSLAFRIDIIMISTMVGWKENGIYVIMVFFANVIEIPLKAIGRISAPIISKAWTEDDMNELSFIYKRSSINLIMIGILIFAEIWFMLPFLDTISVGEDRFVLYRYVFLFVALGKLFGMLNSVNGQIIIYSDVYRYNLLFLLILGVVNVILNAYLISKYQILGAALATCFSYCLFNSIKFCFLWFRYKMSPVSIQTLKLLFIAASVFTLTHFLPISDTSMFGPVARAILFGVVYVPLVFLSNISTEANELLRTTFNKIRRKS